jgi:hypothetical protein
MALQFAAKDCSINQTLASMSWEGGNIYRQLAAAMVHPGRVRHATKCYMGLGVESIATIVLGHQAV